MPEEIAPDSPAEEPKPNDLTRRQVLLGSLGFLVALTGGLSVARVMAGRNDLNIMQTDDPSCPVGTKREAIERSDNYGNTIAIQAVAMVIKRAVHEVIQNLGVAQGGAAIDKSETSNVLRDKPVKSAFFTILLAPLIEEVGFRASFSDMIKPCDDNVRWDVGALSSAIFAVQHCFGFSEEKGVVFKKTVPFTQFLGGMLYWYFLRTRGVAHSFLAHVMNNAVFAGIPILAYKALPEEMAKKVHHAIDG